MNAIIIIISHLQNFISSFKRDCFGTNRFGLEAVWSRLILFQKRKQMTEIYIFKKQDFLITVALSGSAKKSRI